MIIFDCYLHIFHILSGIRVIVKHKLRVCIETDVEELLSFKAASQLNDQIISAGI